MKQFWFIGRISVVDYCPYNYNSISIYSCFLDSTPVITTKNPKPAWPLNQIQFRRCATCQFVDWSPTGFSIYCFKDPKAMEPEAPRWRGNHRGGWDRDQTKKTNRKATYSQLESPQTEDSTFSKVGGVWLGEIWHSVCRLDTGLLTAIVDKAS